jgi:hypothetical protein
MVRHNNPMLNMRSTFTACFFLMIQGICGEICLADSGNGGSETRHRRSFSESSLDSSSIHPERSQFIRPPAWRRRAFHPAVYLGMGVNQVVTSVPEFEATDPARSEEIGAAEPVM